MVRNTVALLKETFARWNRDNATRLSAALSYYTVFSLAPLLILAISIAGLVFGRDAAQGQIVEQLSELVGRQSAVTIQSMIEAAWRPAAGVAATVIGTFTLLLGASGVMVELKSALNRIWGAKSQEGFRRLVVTRLLSFGMVLVIGFLLLVSLIVSAVISALGKYLAGFLPMSEAVLQALNLALSLGVITLLFAIIYKVLPDMKIAWRDVWLGAAVTSLLFTLGKFLIGLYLGKSAVGSSYGAAGSVLVLLLWVYYSAFILYFGAEFTKVHSDFRAERRPA